MRLAAGGTDAVRRHRQAARLQPLLQLGLRVFRPARDVGRLDDLAEQAFDDGACGVEAAIEKGRADHSFERVGQDRRALRAAAAGLTVAQVQHLGQRELQRDPVQALFAHQMRAHARQVAFVGAFEALVQQAGDGQAQHRVTEKFKPLVVVGTEAAVRQRAAQQARVAEAVTDAPLQCVQAGVHRLCGEPNSSGPRT